MSFVCSFHVDYPVAIFPSSIRDDARSSVDDHQRRGADQQLSPLGFPDPFAVATVGGEQTHTTSVIKKTLNPYWNEPFDLYVAAPTFYRELWSRRGGDSGWDICGVNRWSFIETGKSTKTVFSRFKFSTKRSSRRRIRVSSASSTYGSAM